MVVNILKLYQTKTQRNGEILIFSSWLAVVCLRYQEAGEPYNYK